MFVLFEMVEFHEQIWLSFLEMKLAASQKMLSAMVLLKGTHGRAVVAVASSGHRAAHAEPLVDARTYVAPAGSHVVLNGAQPVLSPPHVQLQFAFWPEITTPRSSMLTANASTRSK